MMTKTWWILHTCFHSCQICAAIHQISYTRVKQCYALTWTSTVSCMIFKTDWFTQRNMVAILPDSPSLADIFLADLLGGAKWSNMCFYIKYNLINLYPSEFENCQMTIQNIFLAVSRIPCLAFHAKKLLWWIISAKCITPFPIKVRNTT